MPLRERYVLRAIALAGRGVSVDITGEPGSGRSHVLRVVRDHFAALHWDVLDVSGAPALVDSELSGLAFAGVDVASPAETVDALVARLVGGRAVITVDDWDRLDRASRSVLRLVRDRAAVPIVTTRLDTSMIDRAAQDLHVARVQLDPFTTPELALALRGRCGADLNAATLAAIMMKSGGNIGIAMAMITDAEQEGRLTVRGGRVALEGTLWTARLSATLERLLAALGPAERDALEFVARFGPIPLDTAAKVIDPDVLRALERAGSVVLGVRDGEPSVRVGRPAILAHFLHSDIGAGFLLFVDAALDALAAEPGEPVAHEPLLPEPAMIPRVRLALAVDAWRRRRTRHAAAAVAECLWRLRDYDGAERMLETAADLDADDAARLHEERVRVALLRSRGRSGEAYAGLLARAGDDPLGIRLRARAAVLQSFHDGVVDADDLPDEHPDPAVEAELRRARGFARYSRGDVAAVDEALPALLRDFPDDDAVLVLACLVEVAQGRTANAMRIASRRRDDLARQALIEPMHDFAYLEVLAAVIGGHLDRVDDAVDALRTDVGPSHRTALLRGAAGSLLTMAGHADGRLLRTHVADAAGGIIGSGAEWWHAADLRRDGDEEAASAALAVFADRAAARGAAVHAAYAAVIAAWYCPGPERLAQMRARIESVSADGIRAHAAVVEALVARDVAAMGRAAGVLEELGQLGRARAAWRRFAAVTTGPAARRADDEAQRIGAVLEPPTGSVEDAMTARERQIVRMSVSGLSQAEIARDLVLSVRTVESHLHRALRKVGPELFDLINTYSRKPRAGADARGEAE
ncbi:sigma factor-like helix-turn-helix DNA-binding protein [Microbacterium sp. GXF7504]